MRLIVDGMNVIGTTPDGWWRDRAAARRRLVDEVAPLVAPDRRITVIFDGRAGPGEADGGMVSGVEVGFAPGGPNAADDAIVALIEGLEHRDGVTVVTSDRGLVQRAGRLGVRVESARSFRSRLDAVNGTGPSAAG